MCFFYQEIVWAIILYPETLESQRHLKFVIQYSLEPSENLNTQIPKLSKFLKRLLSGSFRGFNNSLASRDWRIMARNLAAIIMASASVKCSNSRQSFCKKAICLKIELRNGIRVSSTLSKMPGLWLSSKWLVFLKFIVVKPFETCRINGSTFIVASKLKCKWLLNRYGSHVICFVLFLDKSRDSFCRGCVSFF